MFVGATPYLNNDPIADLCERHVSTRRSHCSTTPWRWLWSPRTGRLDGADVRGYLGGGMFGAARAARPGVLHVLYLIFNERYAASTGPHVARADLSSEAIRLVRALRQALPDEPEATGLLALMLLTDARRPARTANWCRQGSTLPAHLTSGGKAILAAMDDDDVRVLYSGGGKAAARDASPVDVDKVLIELRAVRRGYAINREATERGVSAIGLCVTTVDGDVAGLSIAMPTARFPRHLAALHQALSTTAAAVRVEVAAAGRR